MKKNSKQNQTPPTLGYIEKFGLYFAKNYRVTLILVLGVLLLGYLSYTSFLRREGFPPINFPIASININYLANSPQEMDEGVITPIEEVVSRYEEVESVRSSNFGRAGNVIISFEGSTENVEDLLDKIKQSIDADQRIPDEATINYLAINPSSVNGQDDLLLNLVFEQKENQALSIQEVKDLQDKASTLSSELAKVSGVAESRVLNQVNSRINPIMGQPVDVREEFNRVGQKENGGFASYDAISIGIKKDVSIGAVELSSAVSSKIDDLKELGQLEGLKVIKGYDPADVVGQQISSLESNVIYGLLVVAISLLFIGGWRSSLIVVIFIPIVLALAFLGLFILGYSLNVITLFGLILVLGIIADDAIVVLEAIEYYKKQGLYGYEAVRVALKDIGVSDIAGSLTTILVFVPMVFISGILGEFIKAIPVTVILTLSASLLVGLSVVVFLSNLLFRSSKNQKKASVFSNIVNLFPNLVDKFAALIGSFVSVYLKIKGLYLLIVALSIIVVVGLTSYYGKNVGFSLFPQSKDGNELSVNVRFDEGTQIERAQEISQRVEKIVKDEFSSSVEKFDYVSADARNSLISLALTDYGKREEKAPDLAKELQAKIESANIDGADIKVTSVATAGPPEEEYPFSVKVYSQDQSKLENSSKAIQEFIAKQTFGETNVSDTRINNLNTIVKEDGRRVVTIQASFEEGYDSATLQSASDAVAKEFNETRLTSLGLLASDVEVNRGQDQEFGDSFNSAIVAFIGAVLLMYVFLVALYKSFLQPLLIFVAVPFTIPGVMMGLDLTDNALSFFVFIGFIALFGVVVNNSILLVSYANTLRENGRSLRDAITEAVKVRTKPILATTVTTLGGLIPLALTDPFWEALAFTIIFGLTSSLILIILTFPAYYVMFEQIRELKNRFFAWIKNRFALEI